MQDRPPVVWLPSLDHGAHLLAWLLRDDGEWWAHLQVIHFVPDAGFGQRGTFYGWELTAHSSLIEQRAGWDYSGVPRRRT
ncbi:hypothetical protein Sme01_03190 [Sphaerisporangium melleum]|uniref:Uncharacterized protein n=1 Tax=Sphaerisporangium melleum TaxID=321316 RepID=A0A917VC14_9ACTN|nr:hypothetical protein [Sphaerisporangium melleum]GGK61476.1 hypothetical protein GCM10007964_00730 [Sphaerisporangium melleum]GII67843.1 hypothetical protein Sme01_03190 [Sphaerisporangium melleum]